MTGPWRVALASAVVGLAMVNAPVAAQAAECAGVTVVVDFRSLGGGVRTGCAAGDPATGTAALTAAGFGYTFASRQPGFVCRINGVPGSDPCVSTAPPTAYWGYWHGSPGGSWTYSSTSASAYDPAPGSVEGWSFGAGEQPGIAPPAPQPVQPAPQPPAAGQPTQPAQPGQPAPPAPPQPGEPTQSTTQPSEMPTSTTTGTTTAPPSSTTTTGSTTSDSVAPTTAVAVEPTASTSSGGTVGLVVVIVVIATLAGLGVWTARRRARAAE